MSARAAVRAALAAKITSLGYTPLEYRDEDDAITEGDLPCVLIQQAGPIDITQEDHAGGQVYHEGSFILSFAALTTADAEAMLTATVAALANDYTLGGKVQNIVPASWGDEETDGKDFASIMFEVRITFCTAFNDWSTLIY